VVGYWLLVVGCLLLVVGWWLLMGWLVGRSVGGCCFSSYPKVSSFHPACVCTCNLELGDGTMTSLAVDGPDLITSGSSGSESP